METTVGRILPGIVGNVLLKFLYKTSKEPAGKNMVVSHNKVEGDFLIGYL